MFSLQDPKITAFILKRSFYRVNFFNKKRAQHILVENNKVIKLGKYKIFKN